MNEKAQAPPRQKSFYEIVHQPDGTADVYLTPCPGHEPVYLVPGLEYTDDLAEDVRRHYYSYLEIGEVVYVREPGIYGLHRRCTPDADKLDDSGTEERTMKKW